MQSRSSSNRVGRRLLAWTVPLVIAGLVVIDAPARASEEVRKAANLPIRAATGARTLPPLGWVMFCKRYGDDRRKPCVSNPLPAVDVVIDEHAMTVLDRVNRAVNAEVEPVTDIDHWGVIDQWDYPDDGRGDCEDYVLEKRDRLLKAGFPRQALLVTVVRDLQGEGHAVLTVKTDRGDLILDNQVDDIVLWRETGYHFIKRQSQENPMNWLSLSTEPVEFTSSDKAKLPLR